MKETDWWDQAFCLKKNPYPWMHDPNAFNDWEGNEVQGAPSTNLAATRKFAARCNSHCLVRLECLNDALRHEAGTSIQSRHGIRGGMNPEQRIKEERRRADDPAA